MWQEFSFLSLNHIYPHDVHLPNRTPLELMVQNRDANVDQGRGDTSIFVAIVTDESWGRKEVQHGMHHIYHIMYICILISLNQIKPPNFNFEVVFLGMVHYVLALLHSIIF